MFFALLYSLNALAAGPVRISELDFYQIDNSSKVQIPNSSVAQIHTNSQSGRGQAFYIFDNHTDLAYASFNGNDGDSINDVQDNETVLLAVEYKSSQRFAAFGFFNGIVRTKDFRVYFGDSFEDIRQKARRGEYLYYGTFYDQSNLTQCFQFGTIHNYKVIGFGLVNAYNNERVGCGELYLYSQRFQFNVTKDKSIYPDENFDKSNQVNSSTIKAETNSQTSGGGIRWVLDGSETLGWSQYSEFSLGQDDEPINNAIDYNPVLAVLDLGQVRSIRGFGLANKAQYKSRTFEFYTGSGFSDILTLARGRQYHYNGTIQSDAVEYYELPVTQQTQYLGFAFLTCYGERCGMGEISVYEGIASTPSASETSAPSESQNLSPNPNEAYNINRLNPDKITEDIIPTKIEIREVTTNSQSRGGAARYAIDGDITLAWGSYFDGSQGPDEAINTVRTNEPILLFFDLGEAQLIRSFAFAPRQAGQQLIQNFEIYFADNIDTIRRDAVSAKPKCFGTFSYGENNDDRTLQYFNLPEEQTARYMALGARTYLGNQATCGEFEIFSEFILFKREGSQVEKISGNVIAALKQEDRMPDAYDNNSIQVSANSQSDGGAAYYANDAHVELAWGSYGLGISHGGANAIFEIQGDEPILLFFQLDQSSQINAFGYYPRPSSASGWALDFEIYTGSSIEDIRAKANDQRSVCYGRFEIPISNHFDWQYFNLPSQENTQYFALGIRTYTGNQATVGEFKLFGSQFDESIPPISTETVIPTPTPQHQGTKITQLNYSYIQNNAASIPASYPYSNITVITNSQSCGGAAFYVSDGNPTTSWGSYMGECSGSADPINESGDGLINLILDLGESSLIRAFRFYPPYPQRPEIDSIDEFELYFGSSLDDINNKISTRSSQFYGMINYGTNDDDFNPKFFNIHETTARFMAFSVTKTRGTQARCGELTIYPDFITLSPIDLNFQKLINRIDPSLSIQQPVQLDKALMATYTNSQSGRGQSFYAIDSNAALAYGSYRANSGDDAINDIQGDEPILLIIDLGSIQRLCAFGFIPKTDQSEQNGLLALNFEIYIGSTVADIRSKAQKLDAVAYGEFTYPDSYPRQSTWQYFNLPDAYYTQYFALGIRTFTGNQVSVGEVNLYSNFFAGVDSKTTLSDIAISSGIIPVDAAHVDLNRVQRDGNCTLQNGRLSFQSPGGRITFEYTGTTLYLTLTTGVQYGWALLYIDGEYFDNVSSFYPYPSTREYSSEEARNNTAKILREVPFGDHDVEIEFPEENTNSFFEIQAISYAGSVRPEGNVSNPHREQKKGFIAGIAVACVIIVALIVLVVLFFVIFRRNQSNEMRSQKSDVLTTDFSVDTVKEVI